MFKDIKKEDRMIYIGEVSSSFYKFTIGPYDINNQQGWELTLSVPILAGFVFGLHLLNFPYDVGGLIGTLFFVSSLTNSKVTLRPTASI